MTRCIILAFAIAIVGCTCETEERTEDWTPRLAPEQALADLTEEWADRWEAATGRTILVGTEGAPVLAQADLDHVMPDGSVDGLDCGQTAVTFHTKTGEWMSTEWMLIDTTSPGYCPGTKTIIGHEMGHALSACRHTSEPATLLFKKLGPGAASIIDTVSLTKVCETSGCPIFAPEDAND